MDNGEYPASESKIFVQSATDIMNLIGDAYGASGILLTESNLAPSFFDLKTGLAGELFQKLTNYRLRCAIVITNPLLYGERFIELAREHQNHNTIRFFPSANEAKTWLQS